ncbi:hypothetical protein D3C86_2015400 [compost metagenome]
MAGAYILAGELYRGRDYEEAFRNYEKIMKPYVQECQKLPPGIPRIVYPESRVGVALLNQLIAIVGSKPVKWLMRVFSGDKKDNKKDKKKEIILPDY